MAIRFPTRPTPLTHRSCTAPHRYGHTARVEVYPKKNYLYVSGPPVHVPAVGKNSQVHPPNHRPQDPPLPAAEASAPDPHSRNPIEFHAGGHGRISLPQ